MRHKQIPVDDLTPHPQNARQGDVGAISVSLEEHGQYKPIVVNERNMTILAGNHTWLAAKALGWKKIATVLVDVDDEQARRILLVDNRTNDLASYDDTGLAELLEELAATPSGLAGTGFDGDDLDQLLADLNVPSAFDRGREGEIAEPPSDPISQPGDVWVLGNHRLFVGDSTLILPQLVSEGVSADLVWTDPPYGVDYANKQRSLDAFKAKRGEYPTDRAPKDIASDTEAELGPLLNSVFSLIVKATKPGSPWYVTGPDGPPSLLFLAGLIDVGVFRQRLVWVKNSPVFGRTDYHYQHETIFYGWTPGAAHRSPTVIGQSSVLMFDSPRANPLHPTMKPVPLIEYCINQSSDPGHTVLDPFAGSGSTMVACQNTGRSSINIELDPGWSDVIVDRYRSLGPSEEPYRE